MFKKAVFVTLVALLCLTVSDASAKEVTGIAIMPRDGISLWNGKTNVKKTRARAVEFVKGGFKIKGYRFDYPSELKDSSRAKAAPDQTVIKVSREDGYVIPHFQDGKSEKLYKRNVRMFIKRYEGKPCIEIINWKTKDFKVYWLPQ